MTATIRRPGGDAIGERLRCLPGLAWIASADGRLDWMSNPFRRYVGQVPDDILDVVHWDDKEALAALGGKALASDDENVMKARLRCRDGGFRWHLVQAAPVTETSWIGTAADIHAETTAMETLARDNEELEQDVFKQLHELNRSRSRLQAIFDACPDYLYLLRLQDGAVTFEDVNPAAAILFNGDRAGIVGLRIEHVAGIEAPSSLAARVRATLSGGAASYQVERRSDGKPSLIVEIVGAPIAYSNEEEGLVLFCGRDMTEQRAAEDALRQSQKMEAVGQLTGGLAHDFNNLLTGIMGSLDLLQARAAQGRYDRIDRYLETAQEAARRAAALTHRLLAFSRRQTLDPKPTDANALIGGMEELLRRTVGPEITLRITYVENPWTVLIDVSQLENALLNLCINARDAMPDGGRIDIETRHTRLTEQTAGERDLPPADYVAISVSDDGTGMPPEVATRIFDPFFTTKPIGSGTGLGLSMIYGFARQSGGNVRVHSQPGLGTTMRVLLPRHHGEAEGAAERASFSEAPRTSAGESILLVDDEHSVRSLVAEVLEELGYRMTIASNGNEGLERLRSRTSFDVLITDVGLPGGLNGRQIADAARDLRPKIKVLFITGYAETAVLNHGHLAPGMQVLTKPFTMEALASSVKRIIEGSAEK